MGQATRVLTLVVLLIPRPGLAREPAPAAAAFAMPSLSLPAPDAPEPPLYRPGLDPETAALRADLQTLATFVRVSLGGGRSAGPGRSAAPWNALDAGRINAWDRTVVGRRSSRADAVSDGGLYTSLLAPHAATLLEVLLSGADLDRLSRHALLLAKSWALSASICDLVKHMAGRARPYMYDPRTEPGDLAGDDARRSFYSGHTAWSFTMASSFSYLFHSAHPDSPWVVPVWLGTHAVATGTALTRVLAGKHFWTDVLTGAAVGSALGLAVPLLDDLARSSPRHAWIATLRLVPRTHPGGFGLAVMGDW